VGSSSLSAQQDRLNRITNGAYWFGIVGRLSIFMGILFFLVGTAMCLRLWADPIEVYNRGASVLVQSIPYFLYGWLFLLGRDALEAIRMLIQEIGEIV